MREKAVDLSAQPLRNLARNNFATSSAGVVLVNATGAIASNVYGTSPGWRGTRTGTAAGAVYFLRSAGSYAIVTPGVSHVAQVMFRTSFAGSYAFRTAKNTLNTIETTLSFNVAANTWTRLVLPFVPVDPNINLSILFSATTIPDGTVVEVSQPMVTVGTAVPDYADGNTAGWRWTGTANLSESVGYPLAPNLVTDSLNMTGWNSASRALSDPTTEPGCPMPAWMLGSSDARISPPALWIPSAEGYQEWFISGYAVAPAAISTNLIWRIRYGSVYSNTFPNGTFASTSVTLAAASYRVWTYFSGVIKGTLPTGGVPTVTPNGTGVGWQVAGIQFRRNIW